MLENYQGKIFLKAAIPALIAAAKELPIVGVPLRMGSAFFEKWTEELRLVQDALPDAQRPEQLEQASALSPSQARDLALELLAADKQGQVLDQEQREAVADVVAMIPARIRERTQATLMQAKRYGTVAQEVLPLNAKASTSEREEFYRNLLPASRPQFKPGDALPHGNPEWRLLQLIGTGGFGEVWRSRHDYLGEERAVKFCQNQAGSAILQREAVNLYHLRQALPKHPHIVRLYDLQLKHQPFWLTFEYIPGGTLDSLLRARGAIPWREALIMLYPVWHAMAQVHNLGIVHRDLKPANILLDAKNVPKIGDFGIGKVLAEQVESAGNQNRRSQGMTTRGYGSAGYMSPEQEEGEVAHPADDTYALAMILWQMLAGSLGRTPRYPKDIQALDAPDMLKKIISYCRFSAREQRPSDAKLLPYFKHLVQHQTTRTTQQAGIGTTAPPLKPATVIPTSQPITAAPIVDPVPETIVSTIQPILHQIVPQDGQDAPTSAPQIEPTLASESLTPTPAVVLAFSQDKVILDTAPKISIPNDTSLPEEETDDAVEDTDSNQDASEAKLTDTSSNPPLTTVVAQTAPHDHYLIHQDGTVTDTRSGLMWKRCAEGQIWDGTCKGNAVRMTWDDCMPDGKQKSWQEFAGYNDWRLPTREELQTLVYCSSGQPLFWNNKGSKQCSGIFQKPTIDQAAFPNTQLATFWTAFTTNEKHAHLISFKLGYQGQSRRSSTSRVRLMRGTFLTATAKPVPDNVIVEEPTLTTDTTVSSPISVTESLPQLPAEPQTSPLVAVQSQDPVVLDTASETSPSEAIDIDFNQEKNEVESTPASSTPNIATSIVITQPHDHYAIHRDGTVTDTRTGLMWKRCTEGQIWDGNTCKGGKGARIPWNDCMPDGKQKSWPEFAGYNDWRLPTCEELLTLVYCSSGKQHNKRCTGEYEQPTIDQATFPNTPLIIWTASTTSDEHANFISFKLGYCDIGFRFYTSRIRLVRGTFLAATAKPVPDNVIVEEPTIATDTVVSLPISVTESLPQLPAEPQTAPLVADISQYPQTDESLIGTNTTDIDADNETNGGKEQYAIIAMLDLALHGENKPTTLADLSARQEISLSYLEQLFADLRDKQLVRGIRGPGGGYNLAKPTKDISIAEIICAIGGWAAFMRCGDEKDSQFDQKTDILWHELNIGSKLFKFLSSISIADLITRGTNKNGRGKTPSIESVASILPTAATESLPQLPAKRPLFPLGADMPQYVQHEHYLLYANGTVTDVTTNLMWKRCAEGQEWDGTNCIGEAVKMTWDQIMPNDKQKSWPDFAGYNDWRVPTIKELSSLIYCSSGDPKTWNNTGKECKGNYARPTIDQTAFPSAPTTWFWSTTAAKELYMLAVFGLGLIRRINKYGSYAVRLVRNVKISSSKKQ